MLPPDAADLVCAPAVGLDRAAVPEFAIGGVGVGLTRVAGYGAAKAGIDSLTRSLAVELGRRGTGIRVNAIAPGFVLGEQNRSLLVRDDGSPTERAATTFTV